MDAGKTKKATEMAARNFSAMPPVTMATINHLPLFNLIKSNSGETERSFVVRAHALAKSHGQAASSSLPLFYCPSIINSRRQKFMIRVSRYVHYKSHFIKLWDWWCVLGYRGPHKFTWPLHMPRQWSPMFLRIHHGSRKVRRPGWAAPKPDMWTRSFYLELAHFSWQLQTSISIVWLMRTP